MMNQFGAGAPFQMSGGYHPLLNPRLASGPYEVELEAYRSIFMETQSQDKIKSFNSGDKIILPDSILRALMSGVSGQFQLPSPVIFEIRSTKWDSVSHCGVLEFTENRQRAILPDWMMSNLLLNDGDKVKLKLRDMGQQKLTEVTFKPQTFSFSKVRDQKARLEHALKRFTVLTQGDEIWIPPMASEKGEGHTLHVKTVKPAVGDPPAGCIVDTDLRVEFDTPWEEKGGDAPPELLEVDRAVDADIKEDQFRYYKLKIGDSTAPVRITVTPLRGDPDLYVSTTDQYPTPMKHTWAANMSGKHSVTIRPHEASFSKNWYYVGVHAYKADAEFRLLATQYLDEDEDEESEKRGASAFAASSGGKSTSTPKVNGRAEDPHAGDPNYKQCANCERYIPKGAFMMHEMHCARNSWRCPDCGDVIKRSEKANHNHCNICKEVFSLDDLAKHVDLVHKPVECECGNMIDPGAMAAHKELECDMRLVKCRWCEVSIPFRDKREHENYCGGKSITCEICQKGVARNRMVAHRAVVHRINPCVTDSGERAVKSPETQNRDQASSASSGPRPMDDIDKVLAASRAEQERKEQEELERILLESAKASGLDGVPAGFSRQSSSASSSSSSPSASGSRRQPPASSRTEAPAPMSSFGSNFTGGSVLQGSGGSGAGAGGSSSGGYAAFGETYDTNDDHANIDENDDAAGWDDAAEFDVDDEGDWGSMTDSPPMSPSPEPRPPTQSIHPHPDLAASSSSSSSSHRRPSSSLRPDRQPQPYGFQGSSSSAAPPAAASSSSSAASSRPALMTDEASGIPAHLLQGGGGNAPIPDLGFHDFPCPYCGQQVSLREDMEIHMQACAKRQGLA